MPEKIECRVRFVTPAFLGNAEQNAQWRTPPFKALLRQWWRVVYAADQGFNVNVVQMRREEGMLFGNAWLSHQEGNLTVTDHRKSLVRIRLDKWEMGVQKLWPKGDPKIRHSEVKNKEGKHVPVGSQLYLGFGPLVFKGETALKSNAAIQAGETAHLSLAVPEEHSGLIRQALMLMHRYGTLGGRSRNGWGSFSLHPITQGDGEELAGTTPHRSWHEALTLDWPHALGQDDKGPLIWRTMPHDDWKTLMRTLAIIKIGLRTQFVFHSGNNTSVPEARHWLSHPVTRHNVKDWKQARLPNSLRFKVRAVATDPNKLVGVIFHVPCLPPKRFTPNLQAITRTWQSVHALLDELSRPVNERRYALIVDANRRDILRQQLDSASLQRIQE